MRSLVVKEKSREKPELVSCSSSFPSLSFRLLFIPSIYALLIILYNFVILFNSSSSGFQGLFPVCCLDTHRRRLLSHGTGKTYIMAINVINAVNRILVLRHGSLFILICFLAFLYYHTSNITKQIGKREQHIF